VILTDEDERDVWMRFLGRSESVQRALPGTALSIVMRCADKKDLVIA